MAECVKSFGINQDSRGSNIGAVIFFLFALFENRLSGEKF